jgi:hypothetical protein
MSHATYDPCEVAYQRCRNAALWRNLWTILLFMFGASVIVFLSASVFLFIREDFISGAISTIGTIANGAGVGWVVSRRGEAVKEDQDAYEEFTKRCGGGPSPAGATGRTVGDSWAERLSALHSNLRILRFLR